MVEKMSSDLGQNSRASTALMKRHESIQKWKVSDTAREEPVRLPKQFTIQFDKGTCLLSAVASGDLDETTTLLDEGVDINYTNVDGLTALHQACIDENEDMVNLLIERAADIEARDNEGWTPLHAAASAGNIEIAQILCDNDADLAAVNNEGEVPIDLAEEDEMEDFLTEEIEKRDLEVEEARNEEERVMLEDVSNWLNLKKIDERLDWQGATALHVAAAKGYNKVITLLLQIGNIDVNVQDNDGWTPVHAAVHWGSKIACELLTDAGGDFEIRNSNGQAPHELAEKDFLKTVETCRKKSKDITKNHKNTRSELPDTDTLMLSAKKAIDLLKKQPPRGSIKGDREKSKSSSKINNDNSVTNNLDSGTESASGESEHESDVEVAKPPQKEESKPPPKRPTVVETPKPTSAPSRTSSILNRDRKEETKPEPSLSTNTTSRFRSSYGRKEEEEPKKEEEPRSGSRFNPQVRSTFSTTSRTTAPPETKAEEKRDDNPLGSRYTNLRQTSSTTKEEKVEDTRSKIRMRTKPEEDDNDSRTRKKEEAESNDDEPSEIETKRLSRPTTEESSDTRRRTIAEDESRMSIAERLRKKNQELISSSDRSSSDRTASDRTSDIKATDRSTDRTSSATDRYGSSRDKENNLSSITTARNRTTLGSTSSDTSTGDTKEVQRKLDQALKDVQEYKQKYEKVLKEKEDLEKQMEQYKEDIEKMQELKSDNLRLKDENGALIRVISKLSRTPAS